MVRAAARAKEDCVSTSHVCGFVWLVPKRQWECLYREGREAISRQTGTLHYPPTSGSIGTPLTHDTRTKVCLCETGVKKFDAIRLLFEPGLVLLGTASS